MKDKLFRAMDIWKRVNNYKVVRYRCFHVLPDNKFCVQNADIFELPLTTEQEKEFNRQFLNNLFEKAPHLRRPCYKSIEEAIFEFDIESELFWED